MGGIWARIYGTDVTGGKTGKSKIDKAEDAALGLDSKPKAAPKPKADAGFKFKRNEAADAAQKAKEEAAREADRRAIAARNS